MAVNWTVDLATGSDEIDNQHKQLFQKMNHFLEACRHETDISEAMKMLKYLDEYVMFHFSAEERIMTEHSYPKADIHKSQHAEFIENLLGLKEDLAKQNHGLGLILKVNRLVFDWMTNHVRISDKALGVYLKSAG